MVTPYLKYLSYVLRHKYYVFLECCKLGIPVRGLIHDWSKFLPSEFAPYAKYFYGKDDHAKKAVGDYGYFKGEVDKTDYDFNMAWLLHQKRSPHHWQYWILVGDEQDALFDMPDACRKEMLADWIGAGRAQGRPDTLAWYRNFRKKIELGAETRKWIEEKLNYTPIVSTEASSEPTAAQQEYAN